ncbi:MAG TPA: hypothetical protein VFO63_19210 [Blastocatellia bacterium]|nr:hypothetical protein [Blastocatellia bacterium]
MQFFQDLGSLVEQRWRDTDYNEEAFPEIAERALVETAPYKQVDPWDVIRWLNTTPQIPFQLDVDGIFGNPPITMYCGPRFHIDVYYWLDGTTSIHQHGFCGAFQVILGSSIHSEYRFEDERKINAYFSSGRITLNEVDLLEEGDVRPILPQRQYIHSLFHLDRPSATVVIRTYRSPSGAPQYEYYKPYFALDPFFKSADLTKRVQGASLLFNMKHPEVDDMIGEALACSDFHTAFALLNLAFNHLSHNRMEKTFGLSTGQKRFEALLEVARRRHGELVDLVLPVFEETRRQNNLVYRRGQITSPEHRFFLALLLNVPDKNRVIEMVRQRFPEQNPVEAIVGWVDELANTKMIGSPEPNVLGIDNLDDDYLFVFQCMLEGLTVEQMKSNFEEEPSTGQGGSGSKELEELYNAIRDSMPFKSIFLDSPAASVNDNVKAEIGSQ